MATSVTCIVDTDGTQNPDYTSLAAAIAGETGASPKCVTGANLVTNDEQLTIECRATSGAADTTPVTISGFTTSADCYIKIYVPPAHRHQGVWDDEKYRIQYTATSGYRRVIVTSIPHIIIDGLQTLGDGSCTENIGIYNNSGTNDGRVLIKNCLVDINLSSGVGFGIYSTYDTEVVNTVIYRANNNGINLVGWNSGSSAVYNCVLQGCAVGINQYGGHSVTVINCAVFNNTDDFSGTMTVTYTASDDNDISGTGNVDISPGATEADDWAAAFTDYTNGDFSIKDANSVLYDAGTDLSSYMEAVDIIGTERPQGSAWDIGAFEYVVSGGLSIPVAMHHYNLLRSA